MNPFEYSNPVGADTLIDRDTETKTLVDRAVDQLATRLQ